MIRLFISLILITWFAASDVFAQRNRAQQVQQVQQATFVTIGDDGIIRLPQQNDAAGIAARNAFEAAQRIITAPPTQSFSFMQPTGDEQKSLFQQAIDTLQSLLVFVNPPEVGPADPAAFVDPTVTAVTEEPAFVPNAFVNAHYLLGMGLIHLNMTNRSDLFGAEEVANLGQAVITYFEGFIQNGVGENSAFVHSLLAGFYLSSRNDLRNAMISIDRCIVLEPREPLHHVVRAQILHRGGYLDAACEALKQARELGDTDVAPNLMRSWRCP
jgi:hypothetical protein